MSRSSKQWLKQHNDDAFVRRARDEGERSRAVYKLDEIQRRDRVFAPGQVVVDLGAAPGGWSEFAHRQVGAQGRVIALDLLPMAPVDGVEIMQGDFSTQATLDALLARLGSDRVDLVLSDMAPNLSGMQSVDQPRAIHLAELAYDFARTTLRPGGSLVVKLFQGQGFDALLRDWRADFATVRLRKPAASRARSNEIYAVCRGLR